MSWTLRVTLCEHHLPEDLIRSVTKMVTNTTRPLITRITVLLVLWFVNVLLSMIVLSDFITGPSGWCRPPLTPSPTPLVSIASELLLHSRLFMMFSSGGFIGFPIFNCCCAVQMLRLQVKHWVFDHCHQLKNTLCTSKNGTCLTNISISSH